MGRFRPIFDGQNPSGQLAALVGDVVLGWVRPAGDEVVLGEGADARPQM